METTSSLFICAESGIGTRHEKSADLYSGTSGRLTSEIVPSDLSGRERCARESGIECGLGTDGIEKSRLKSDKSTLFGSTSRFVEITVEG
jgi:hypothetical protein